MAICKDVPAVPAVLEKEVLTDRDIASLTSEFNAFLVQLESLRSCIRTQASALTPSEIDSPLTQGQEAVIDSKFIAASQASTDAILLVDQLEENSINRFNYLLENARADNATPDSSKHPNRK